MKSVMQHSFSEVPAVKMPRSSFERNSGYKTTFNAGYLVPFFHDDVLPGDTYKVNVSAFARMATPFFPLMDNMYMDTQFFFVPLRLIWDNARKFFGEQANPTDTIDYAIPTMQAHNPVTMSLSDYLGLPPGNLMTHSSLYHRAYNFIWNEWYRDQNLQNSVTVDTGNGPDSIANYVLKKRGKRHDYFTSCLPWPQKGDAVVMPLGSTAPVVSDGTPIGVTDGVNQRTLSVLSGFSSLSLDANAAATDPSINFGTNTGLEADLTSATSATVNDLREAFQVQRLLERDARGGTRYSELVNNHFGVNFYDVSYRPEYLGGGSTVINNNPVTQNLNVAGIGLGDVGAYSTAAFKGHGFTKSFVEHGIVMGIVSVRADLTYQQGIPRQFKKSTRYDIFWPTLAHLGEQEVLNQEIYYANGSTDTDVFGYQERYAEYRYKNSLITGQFRSSHATPLDAWHLSQEFGSLPILGNTFIEETPPMARVEQVPAEPDFIFDSYINMRCARCMPVFSTPGMIDHF